MECQAHDQRPDLALRQDRPRRQRDAPLSGKPCMNQRNIAASVRDRRLNKARAEKLDFNLLMTRLRASVASRIRCRRLRAAIGAQRKAHRAAHTDLYWQAMQRRDALRWPAQTDR